MRRPYFARVFCTALLALLIGCSRNDREDTNRKTEEAREKARAAAHRLDADAHKLAGEAKQEAHTLRQNIDHALSSTGPADAGTTGRAEEKLRQGGQDLRAAGNQAAVKLDRAALIAKVKAKLATDVGLSTVTGIDVDTTGHVVTLRGTVSSEEQKHQVEQAALEVGGVTKVVDELRVQP